MALKNLVVVVDQSAQSTARVNTAILLATKHDAHLTGLFVASPPVLPSYVAGELGEGIRDPAAHGSGTRRRSRRPLPPGRGTGGHRGPFGMAGATRQSHGSDR